MANLQANHHIISSISRRLFSQPRIHPLPISTVPPKHRTTRWPRKHCSFKLLLASSVSRDGVSALVQQRPPSKDGDLGSMIDQMAEVGPSTGVDGGDEGKEEIVDGYLVREYGWKVRRMVEEKNEMKKVAQIQAQAFHVPAFFFDDFFFHFFQADVLSGLYYRLRNSPPDRYACLVAEPAKEGDGTLMKPQKRYQQLVGVVDVTVLRDNDVLRHLQGADEYLYVSGIAVAHNFRRQKVATVLLKACEVISVLWGYEYLVLRAYEDDRGARALYTNAGYQLVSGDPSWVTLFGRKRRVLMIKRLW